MGISCRPHVNVHKGEGVRLMWMHVDRGGVKNPIFVDVINGWPQVIGFWEKSNSLDSFKSSVRLCSSGGQSAVETFVHRLYSHKSWLERYHIFCTSLQLKALLCMGVVVCSRAWPIHRQHSQSRPIVGQSEQSATDDNPWPVHVSGWGHSPNSLSHELYRPPMRYYSSFRGVSVFDEKRP